MREHKTKKILTLVLIYQHPRLLLGMKKRGFGAGRFNGFGGKVQEGESIEQAAKREAKEEANIEILDLSKKGVIEFEFTHLPEIHEVHVFKSTRFLGLPTETEEMKPHWYQIKDIPFAHMWPDDAYWFPLFFQNKSFQGYFLLDESDKILSYTLEEK